MNFDKPGWFRRYLDFRAEHAFAPNLPSQGVRVVEDADPHHLLEQSIYYFLQPTGLLYGFPVGRPFPEMEYPNAVYMSASDQVHLIFVESLFACLVADRQHLLEGLTDGDDPLSEAVALAGSYFTAPDEERHAGRRSPLSWLPRRSPDTEARLEKELTRCIGRGTNFLRLPGFYYNSFLFFDLYYCMEWQRRILSDPDAADAHRRDLAASQQFQRELLIRIMIAAAASSGGIVPAEERLIQWFIRSSALGPQRISDLREALAEERPLSGIQLPEMPWLVRRFMLEAALMTILVDRMLDPEEEEFLNDLVERLGLWQEELDQSRLALEVFILHQEDSLQIFRERSALLNAGDNLRAKASLVIRKNLARLVQEIHETQELYSLMMKSTQTPLTAEEKRKVRAQLMDILKTIPALAIFALPGGSLVLPVLIKLLPFNLLPSAFEED